MAKECILECTDGFTRPFKSKIIDLTKNAGINVDEKSWFCMHALRPAPPPPPTPGTQPPAPAAPDPRPLHPTDEHRNQHP